MAKENGLKQHQFGLCPTMVGHGPDLVEHEVLSDSARPCPNALYLTPIGQFLCTSRWRAFGALHNF